MKSRRYRIQKESDSLGALLLSFGVIFAIALALNGQGVFAIPVLFAGSTLFLMQRLVLFDWVELDGTRMVVSERNSERINLDLKNASSWHVAFSFVHDGSLDRNNFDPTLRIGFAGGEVFFHRYSTHRELHENLLRLLAENRIPPEAEEVSDYKSLYPGEDGAVFAVLDMFLFW